VAPRVSAAPPETKRTLRCGRRSVACCARSVPTTVRCVQEHKTVRIQYAVCADNVAAAKRKLLRRFTEQQVNGYEIEYVVAASGHEAARLNLPDDCVVLLA
jgi:hypothetical protein